MEKKKNQNPSNWIKLKFFLKIKWNRNTYDNNLQVRTLFVLVVSTPLEVVYMTLTIFFKEICDIFVYRFSIVTNYFQLFSNN